jgi:hypothetical protein
MAVKTIHAYKNTASTAGLPTEYLINMNRITHVRKWFDGNGNASYGYVMMDLTTYLLEHDCNGATGIPLDVGVDMVKTKKQLVQTL